MLPDEFYVPRATPVKFDERRSNYVYGSAALKGLEPTLALWKEIKRERVYHFRKATLTITSPGYDDIDPKLLEGCKDVIVHRGLSPYGMQQLLAASDGIFMVSKFPETFGIVFHQCEIANKRVRVLRLAGEDALDTTLANASTFTEANAFVEDFAIEHNQLAAHDFSVSAVLPRWLDVLGFAQQKEAAA